MAKGKIAGLRGMDDVLPPTTTHWQEVETLARHTFSLAGFQEIRTPLVEPYDLFARGVGEATSIVEKQMYVFSDQNNERLVLRPEGTAPVVRAYVASGKAATEPLAKYFYMGPMFRYERPQKGRQRQFFQIGLELLGSSAPAADVEIIAVGGAFLRAFGVSHLTLELNSIGCTTCRPAYLKTLVAFLSGVKPSLCGDCVRRLERNPLRAFDCKEEKCRTVLEQAPLMNAAWCTECRHHFEHVCFLLDQCALAYTKNPRIVRGLDYYMRTAFEWTSGSLGAQNAVGAGGRYDGLVRDLGGPDVPGVGVAFGVERLLLLRTATEKKEDRHGVMMIPLCPDALGFLAPLVFRLRREGKKVEWEYEPRSLKSALRRADKSGAKEVIIVGDEEMKTKTAVLRSLETGEQATIPFDQLAARWVRS